MVYEVEAAGRRVASRVTQQQVFKESERGEQYLQRS